MPEKKSVDPTILDIIEGMVESTRKEIELQIERTARSTSIRDQHDYRAGVFDSSGRSISAVSSAANVDPIIKRFKFSDIYDGDIFIWNHPYESEGGIGQTPDICITAPTFHDGKLACFIQVFGHVLDIGGRVAGSMPVDAETIFDEGLLIPPVKLYEQGVINRSLRETMIANSKQPVELIGDIDAEVNACNLGVKRMSELFDRYGRETIEDCFEVLLERCADDIRTTILPIINDGVYSFEDFVEIVDMVPSEKKKFVKLKVTVKKDDKKLVFDLSGTENQVRIPINLPGNEKYYEKYFSSVFRALQPGILINEGARFVVQVVLPKGTILSPEFPMPTGNRHWTMYRLWDLCLGALAQPLKGRVPAQQDTRHIIGFLGYRENGERFYFRETLGAGSPGRTFADGCDAVSANVRGRNLPCEFVEKFYPIRIRRLGLAMDSGGAGKFRGGLGYSKEYELLVDGRLIVQSDRMYLQPCGVNQGLAGQRFSCTINPGLSTERKVKSKTDHVPVVKGDIVSVFTTGGGGWGNPIERGLDLVQKDLLRAKISPMQARDCYGVAVQDQTLIVDHDATNKLRSKISGLKRKVKLIDRGTSFDEYLLNGDLTVNE